LWAFLVLVKKRSRSGLAVPKHFSCRKFQRQVCWNPGLKIFRTNFAKSKRTKSYKTFPDSHFGIAQTKPKDLTELKALFGVGLKNFGKIFIEAIAIFFVAICL
jgi:hypothetical protein